MNDRYTLNDIIPSWRTNGILSLLTVRHEVPWKNVINPLPLDIEYHGNHSGNKFISPMVAELLDESGVMSESALNTIIDLIYYKYNRNWAKLWEADIVEYNPIENYNMIEQTTTKTTDSRTANNTSKHEHTGTDSIKSDFNTETNSNNQMNNSIFGFDSTVGVNADASDSNNVGTGSGTGNQTNTEQSTDNITGNESSSGSTDVTQEIKRSGNIGVTSSSQLVTETHELWASWSFFEQIYSDIDKVLVVPIFADRCIDGIYQIVKQYVLPIASSSQLGGVKARPATEVQIQPVGIRNGFLYVEPGGGGAVVSVNGYTGSVILNNDDVGAPSKLEFSDLAEEIANMGIKVDNSYSSENAPPYPVTSVNGKTGEVIVRMGWTPIQPPEQKLAGCWPGTAPGELMTQSSANSKTNVYDLSQWVGRWIYVYSAPQNTTFYNRNWFVVGHGEWETIQNTFTTDIFYFGSNDPKYAFDHFVYIPPESPYLAIHWRNSSGTYDTTFNFILI